MTVSGFTRRRALGLLGAAALAPQTSLAQGDKLTIGITLHPYYSFAVNVAGDLANVLPLIPGSANPHGYQPQPADIERLFDMDVLIVNGIGHDEWVKEILAAGGRDDLDIIEANAAVALIPTKDMAAGRPLPNPHTFVSTTAAVQQVYEIARKLGELRPEDASAFRRNAQAYALQIRRLRAEFQQRVAGLDASRFSAATMHSGYDYLFQEFGLPIRAVVEPRHGVSPTARQLAQTIEMIRAAQVNVLFAETYFAGELAETIRAETGVWVYTLSHITDGEFTADKFLNEMRVNVETLERAITESAAL